jgi:hypothetical protein
VILPFVLGALLGKYVRKKLLIVILGIVLATGIGLVAVFEIVPLLFPFVFTILNWMGIPEITRHGMVLVIPDLVLVDELVYLQSFPLILTSVSLAVSILGLVLGIVLGRRYINDVQTPWEQSE